MLFSTPMMFANFQGIKHQTRRSMNPYPVIDHDSGYVFDGKHKRQYDIHNWKQQFIERECKYKIGDIVYCKETWCYAMDNNVQDGAENRYALIFKASESGQEFMKNMEEWKWRSSLFHKQVDSRMHLKITNIRIENLNDISESDAIDEGIERWTEQRMVSKPTHYRVYFQNCKPEDLMSYTSDPIDSYQTLWQQINGEKSWDENPLVWVYDYEIVWKQE